MGETIAVLRDHTWDEVGHVYLVEDQAVLIGQVPVMAGLLLRELMRLGADPALASGPIATTVQDILSVGICLMVATALLRL